MHPSYILKAQQSIQSVVSFDIAHKLFSSKAIQFFMKKKHYGSIISIKTRLGYIVEVTEDHPILTERGMIKAGFVSKEDKIAVHPFGGVIYQIPEDQLIAENALFTKQEADELDKRGLLPLSLPNPHIPIIVKLFGYLLGDG